MGRGLPTQLNNDFVQVDVVFRQELPGTSRKVCQGEKCYCASEKASEKGGTWAGLGHRAGRSQGGEVSRIQAIVFLGSDSQIAGEGKFTTGDIRSSRSA